MAQLARLWWRGLAVVTLVVSLTTALPSVRAQRRLSEAPPITSIVGVPGMPALRFGVDAVEQVVRSVDGGVSWTPIFSPGDAQAPDPSTPGTCLPGNYERITFLAIDPLHPHGLYVGTEGVLGDYLDNGCGNAPGGLYYSATGLGSFVPLNRGLPANADARGGGVAWGVKAIVFDSHNPGTLYVQTDASFLSVPGSVHPANPTAPGIYRSTDGGAQWDPAFTGIATTPCQFSPCRYPGSLAILSAQPGVLLYATDTGFYRSVDRGSHWQMRAALTSSDHLRFLVRIDPYQDALVYVATDRALYRSADGGVHLARLTRSDLPAAADVADITFLNQTPPSVVYLLQDGRRVVAPDAGTGSLSLATATARIPPTHVPGVATPIRTPLPARSPSTAMPTPVPGVAAWPMVGHDAGQSYADMAGAFSPAAVARLHLHWQQQDSSPAVEVAGTLYTLGGTSGKVTAYNAVTGAVAHRYQSTAVQGLAYDEHLLYFNRGSEVRIVDAATAAWLHSATNSQGSGQGTVGSMVVAAHTLFTGVGAQNAGSSIPYYAFDSRTGRLLWHRAGNLSSVPCLAGRTLYLSFGAFGAGDSYLLDPATGAVRRILKGLGTAQWHTSGGRVYASVLRGSGGRFLATVRAYGLDGGLRWVAHDVLFGAALPDRVFVMTPGFVEARSAADGHRIWKSAVPGMQSVSIGTVVAVGDLVLAQASDGRISLLNAGNGSLLRVLAPPVQGANAGDLIVGDGLIFESLSARSAGGAQGPRTLLAFGP